MSKRVAHTTYLRQHDVAWDPVLARAAKKVVDSNTAHNVFAHSYGVKMDANGNPTVPRPHLRLERFPNYDTTGWIYAFQSFLFFILSFKKFALLNSSLYFIMTPASLSNVPQLHLDVYLG